MNIINKSLNQRNGWHASTSFDLAPLCPDDMADQYPDSELFSKLDESISHLLGLSSNLLKRLSKKFVLFHYSRRYREDE